MAEGAFSEVTSMITEGIRVNVRTIYLPDESDPVTSHFVFAYHITIVNESPYRVQLMSRRWNITDGTGIKRNVTGDGVVGKQPIIEPGEFHEYVSGCDFQTPIGKMEGNYKMVRLSEGSDFIVRIPPFIMVHPTLLN